MLDAANPDIAIGMVSSLGQAERRARVRQYVFDSPAASRVAWRFLVGNNSGPADLLPWLLHDRDRVPDVLYHSTDGFYHNKQCSCSEKTRFWFRYALKRWPAVPWIAKTEDDTYLHLGKLLFDLSQLLQVASPLAMYGHLGICTAMAHDSTPVSGKAASCYLGDFEHHALVKQGLRAHLEQSDCRDAPPVPFPTGPLAVPALGSNGGDTGSGGSSPNPNP